MVELVEKKIEKEMVNKKWALLFDGWSKTVIHYVALVASFIEQLAVRRHDVVVTESVQRL